MKTTIITDIISTMQFIELRDYMQNLISESMKALDSHDAKSVMWYRDCSLDDYFTEWQEIWDGDVKVGEGIGTIAHKFVLNDDTRADFERAFEEAREAAYEEYVNDRCMKRIEFDESKMRVYAYGYVCHGSQYNSDPEVEMDMQEYLDEQYNGKYEVNERPSYFEEEDCWSAAVWEHDKDI